MQTDWAVYSNPEGPGFLLDVQSSLLSQMNTRVVVPLLPVDGAPGKISRLHPVFMISGKNHLMATHLIAAVPVTLLKDQRGSLSDRHDAITSALDMLFHGF